MVYLCYLFTDSYRYNFIAVIELEIIGKSEARWSRTMPTIPYIKIYSETKKVLYIKNTDIFGNYIGTYSEIFVYHFVDN